MMVVMCQKSAACNRDLDSVNNRRLCLCQCRILYCPVGARAAAVECCCRGE